MVLQKSPTNRLSFPALALLLLAAFAIGGGGSRYGLANLAVQLTAIAVLALHREAFLRFWSEAPLVLRMLILASLALPLLQILPLPPAFWTALPGRALVARSLEVAGESGWMPLSLNPSRTLLAWTALVTPMAILVTGWSLPRQRLVDVGWMVAALGVFTAFLGVFQLGAPEAEATIFGARSPGKVLLGTFANRNSTGLFLGFALGLVAVLPAPRHHPAIPFVRLAICVLLLVAIILTKSRTALVLALLPIALGALKALWWFLEQRSASRGGPNAARTVGLVFGTLALVSLTTASIFLVAPGRVGETLERFEAKDDPRRFIWDDATYTLSRYWPAGAGMGTFDEVFQVDESLENMTPRRAGRAHNDYIELAIESGIAGLSLAAIWLTALLWLSWLARQSHHRWTGWAGGTFLLAIGLQSITDYPLRNQTMLALAGLALLLLVRSAASDRRARS